ncbi:MAG: PadR family transcriptional regulator [Acidobacteriaceae bacterium]
MKSAEKTSTVESLLGLLSLGPMSGYEMRQMMERSTANFWTESYGQIYPALKGMVKDGLATVEEQVKDGRAKKVYKLTDAGERRLKKWLGVETKPQPQRNELLLKVFFGDRAEPGAIAAQIVAERERCEDDLERFGAALLRMETQHAKHPAMAYWKMTVRCGILNAKATMEWCDEVFVELEKRGLINKQRVYQEPRRY